MLCEKCIEIKCIFFWLGWDEGGKADPVYPFGSNRIRFPPLLATVLVSLYHLLYDDVRKFEFPRNRNLPYPLTLSDVNIGR